MGKDMGMTVVIRIERTEMDPQAIKELLAMACEYYGYGVRVVEVRRDDDRRAPPPPPAPRPKPKRKSWEERQAELNAGIDRQAP